MQVSLRSDIRDALARDDLATAERLLAENRGGLRHVTGLTYHQDSNTRRRASRAIALAGKHHPKQVQEIARRLIWAMNEEAGTNAAFAPDTLRAIAEELPELLLPMVPDLMRLAHDDEGLREGLSHTLRAVANGCDGKVGKRIAADINESMARTTGGRRGG